MEPYNDPSMNCKRNKNYGCFSFYDCWCSITTSQIVVLFLPFTSTQILTRNLLWLYRYAFVLETQILLLRTFTRVHAISGSLFEAMLYFLRNINLGGMGTTSAHRATSSQLRWSFLVKTKRTLFPKIASICKQCPQEKKNGKSSKLLLVENQNFVSTLERLKISCFCEISFLFCKYFSSNSPQNQKFRKVLKHQNEVREKFYTKLRQAVSALTADAFGRF